MSEESGGFLGGLKRAAVEGGWLQDDKKGTPETAAAHASAPAAPIVISIPTATGSASNANPNLVEQLRKIALAPANSPLTNTFMRHLTKAQKLETDPTKAVKMALMFSEIPVTDLVKEIENAIAANLAAHKRNFDSEVAAKRGAIDSQYTQRQQALEGAIARDQGKAEEIRESLAANTAELSSLAVDKAGEVAAVDKTDSEAHASLAVVEGEINSLLASLKAA